MEDEYGLPNPFEDTREYDTLSTTDRVEVIRDCVLELTDAVRDAIVFTHHCHEDILELARRDTEKDKRIEFLEQMLMDKDVDPQCEADK